MSTKNQLLAASAPHLQAQPWLVSKPTSNWRETVSVVATKSSLTLIKWYLICLGSSVHICVFFPSPAPLYIYKQRSTNLSPHCDDPIFALGSPIPAYQVLTPSKGSLNGW